MADALRIDGTLPFLQHLDAFWVDGKDTSENRRPYDYTTWGGEVYWAFNEKIRNPFR